MSASPRETLDSPQKLQDACISTEGLSVSYAKSYALRDLHLEIPRGSITALVGPSGCGKSSFLKTLNRLTDLITGCRVTGSVRLDGEDIYQSGFDVLSLRRRVGMIFQKPNPFPLSIRRNLTLPLEEHGTQDSAALAAKTEAALRDVGLWDEVKDRLDSSAMILSGGQQQRLCIARALALGPEVVLLDEPCSALDPLSSAVVEDLIASLRESYTVIIVTHNLSQARRIADQTALFWLENGAGTLIETAPTEQFFSQPQHRLTKEYVSGARG